MEFRNSFDSAFGRVRYDLYDKRRELECEMMRKNWRNNKRRELECEMMRKNWRNNTGYLEMEEY